MLMESGCCGLGSKCQVFEEEREQKREKYADIKRWSERFLTCEIVIRAAHATWLEK
jgi:hypothetical protein